MRGRLIEDGDLQNVPFVAVISATLSRRYWPNENPIGRRIVLVGTVAGGSYELDARYVMGKRLQIRGTVLRARSFEEKIAVTRAFAAEVVPLLAHGVLRPNVDSVFPMSEIAKAHQRLESNETFGKVVVVMG